MYANAPLLWFADSLIQRGVVQPAAGTLSLIPPGVDDPDRTAHDPFFERGRVVDVGQRLLGYRDPEELAQWPPALARLPHQQPVGGDIRLDPVVPALHCRRQPRVVERR